MEGEVIVVFGASGGIGARVCELLTKMGCRVILAGRTQDKLQPLAQKLGQEFVVIDVNVSDQVDKYLGDIAAKYGRIDGVVNCVGSLILKPLHSVTDQEWENTIRTNLSTAFYILRAACPLMAKQKKGSIVLLSSVAAKVGMANHEVIAAAKAGIVGLVRSAAASYANKGVRINAISPGLVRTPMTTQITADEISYQSLLAMHALGRIGEPEDVAQAIVWLLSEHSGWMTGQVINVDGGLSTVRTKPTISRS